MVYEYEDRIMVVFTDKSRASYSKKRYGSLLQKVVDLSVSLDEKVWNYFEIEGEITKIYYYDQQTREEIYTLIDTEDLAQARGYYWTLNANGYMFSRTGGKRTFLHNLIINDESKDVTDHINRNKLDNRKVNLRRASFSTNNFNKTMQRNNTSTKTGVDFYRNKWRSRIQYNGEAKSKTFDTFEEAVKQREKWEKELTVRFNDYDESQ